jgi:hypothetical protein
MISMDCAHIALNRNWKSPAIIVPALSPSTVSKLRRASFSHNVALASVDLHVIHGWLHGAQPNAKLIIVVCTYDALTVSDIDRFVYQALCKLTLIKVSV